MQEPEFDFEADIPSIDETFPISGVDTTNNTHKTFPDASKQKVKKVRTSIKDARKKNYEPQEIEQDLKLLLEFYNQKNNVEVKTLVQKYDLYNKKILKTLLIEKAKEYNIEVTTDIDPSEPKTNNNDVTVEEKVNNEDISKDYATLQELIKTLKERENVLNEMGKLLNGGRPSDLSEEERKKYDALTLKLNMLPKKPELDNQAKILLEKYGAEKLDDLATLLETKYKEITPVDTKYKEITPVDTKSQESKKDTPKDKKEPQKDNSKHVAKDESTTEQPSAANTIVANTTAPATPASTSQQTKASLPSNNALTGRKVEGTSFNYIAPVYDEYGNVSNYKIISQNIEEYLDDPEKAYKLILKDVAKNLELWEKVGCQNSSDIRKKCNELRKSFSKTYRNDKNYDLCLKKLLALRTAITPDELKTAIEKNEYYDESKYSPVQIEAYENGRYNMHSFGDFLKSIFDKNLVSLKVNKSLPSANTTSNSTTKDMTPENTIQTPDISNAQTLSTPTQQPYVRHRRADKYKNKSKTKDNDRDER